MDNTQGGIAILFLVGIENNPEGREVIDLVEGDVLLLHLLVDAVEVFCSPLHGTRQIEFLHFLVNNALHFFGITFPLVLSLDHPFHQFRIFFRMEVFEREFLQFDFHPVYAEAVCERGVDFEGFLRDEFPFVQGLEFKGPHIMNPVGQPYDENPDIGRHGKHHFSEIFRLSFQLASKGNLADFRQSVDNEGHIISEGIAYLLDGRKGVLHRVMEKPRHDRRDVEPHINKNTGNFKGMNQVGLTGKPHLSLVNGCGKDIGLLHHLDFVMGQVGLGLIEYVGNSYHCPVSR